MQHHSMATPSDLLAVLAICRSSVADVSTDKVAESAAAVAPVSSCPLHHSVAGGRFVISQTFNHFNRCNSASWANCKRRTPAVSGQSASRHRNSTPSELLSKS